MALTSPNVKLFFGLSKMASMEKSELLKNVGKKIQEIRIEKGLTQVDLVGRIEGEIDTTP